MNIWSIGVNHRSAPIEIREKLAFNQEQLPEIVKNIVTYPGVQEAVLLSTCNRTELYCVAEDLFSIGKRVLLDYFNVDELRSYTYTYADYEAITHLMRVSCGLDSMVLGEPQILGQLKQAYKLAANCNGVGRILGRLFQRTFATAKLVRMNTNIGIRPVSVASVVISLAKSLFSDLKSSTILVLGAGDTASQLLTHLKGIDVDTILIANRTVSRAISLAERLGISNKSRCFGIDDVPSILYEADIVLGATGAPGSVVDSKMVKDALRKRKFKSMCFFDLAVPRDISPDIANLDNVFLYGVDDLKEIIAKNKKERFDASSQGEQIIAAEAYGYMKWFYAQEHNSLLADFRAKFELKKQEVIRRAKTQLSRGVKADDVVAKVAHSISQEFLHIPTLAIKNASESRDKMFIESIEKLFEIKNK